MAGKDDKGDKALANVSSWIDSITNTLQGLTTRVQRIHNSQELQSNQKSQTREKEAEVLVSGQHHQRPPPQDHSQPSDYHHEPPPQVDPVNGSFSHEEFKGNHNMDEFFEWIRDVERFSEFIETPKNKKEVVAYNRLKEEGSSWCVQIQSQRTRSGKLPKMKSMMRYLPPYYYDQLLFEEYYSLRQGSRLDDYFDSK